MFFKRIICIHIKKQYTDYLEYKANHCNKSLGEIYIYYSKLDPIEMIAVDTLINRKHMSPCFDYIKLYFEACNEKYNMPMVKNYAFKVKCKMYDIIEPYKFYLNIYKILPYVFSVLDIFMALLYISILQGKKRNF